jgi:hypothetical protein
MRRKRNILLSLVFFCVVEIALIQAVPFFESYNYPLVSSLTCIETENSKDLYWNVNQVEVVDCIKGEKQFCFRYENIQSPKVKWLQQYTLPIIADSRGQWDMFLSLRRWVREQIPNRDPLIESQWDAQRILQTVWKDDSVGFICDAYAATYVSACVSVGLTARMFHLGDVYGKGHYVTEVWSDDYAKWVLMDPLYNCHFTLHGLPLSALELHHLWKNKTWEGLKKQRDENENLPFDAANSDYFALFKDIQLINSNDFLSRSFTSVLDLLNGNIRYVRLVDSSNPPYNKLAMGWQLLIFYYLPKIITGFIIPFVVPGCIVLCVILIMRKK